MTTALSGKDIAGKLEEKFPGKIVESTPECILVKPEAVLEIAAYLKDTPEFNFNYLTSLTAVDYYDYFEFVYHLASLDHNHSLVLKARCLRDTAKLPSVTGVWQGADYQERETYDLFGAEFEGHPNLKRIVLWEGFEGYPLRKDYLSNGAQD